MDELLENYQKGTRKTAIYPENSLVTGDIAALMYLGLKLSGEAGEVSEEIGKWYRDKSVDIDGQLVFDPLEWNELKKDLKLEMGDVLWYLSEIANRMGLSLREIMLENQRKLLARKLRGTLRGSGDER